MNAESVGSKAREELDAWVRECVAWHFDPKTGCPFWLRFQEEDGRVVSSFVHEIHPGPLMREDWISWEDFSGAMPGRMVQLKGRDYEIPSDVKGLSQLVAVGLDSGGPDVGHYNVGPLHLSLRCAQYYQRSGDRRALELFRELLFRTTEYYLLTAEGASRPNASRWKSRVP